MVRKADVREAGEIRLPESEMKVMQFLWEKGQASARDAAEYMLERYRWKKNTTYTVLKNLVEKGALNRREPGFICEPLIGKEQVGRSETQSLLERFYEGSPAALFSSFLSGRKISKEEMEEIRKMIEDYED